MILTSFHFFTYLFQKVRFQASFHNHREIERPCTPQPLEVLTNYSQIKREAPRTSPQFHYTTSEQQHSQQRQPSPIIKRSSTTGSEASSKRRSLTRQKQQQHYIYNVTDELGRTGQYEQVVKWFFYC